MNSDTSIELGKIASAHGLNGEVNYVPFNPASDLPEPGMTITLNYPGGKSVPAVVTGVRDKSKLRLLSIQGVTDRTAAEKMAGAIVSCPRSALPALDDDEFYYSDVLGLPVSFPDGTTVGTVTQMLALATDVMEITSPDGEEWMIPIVDGFVRSISATGVIIEPGALDME